MEQKRSYRWVILFIFVFGTAILNFGSLIFASRPVDVMEMYGMNQAQLTAVSTVSQLPGALLSVIIGNLLDRKGVRKVTAVLLALASVCMVWRVFASSYVELFIITLLAGAFFLPISVAAPKCIGAWFPPEEMGISMGIYGAAAGLGTTLAFGLGGLFSSTRGAFIFIAGGYVLMLILWLILGRENPVPEGMPAGAPPAPPKGSVGRVVKSKYMWMVMVCGGLSVGAALLLNTYLVNAFVAKGLAPTAASGVATLLNVALLIGGVVSGIVVSKVGRYNVPYIVICVGGAVLYYLAYILPISALTYVLVFVGGIVISGSIGVNMARIPLLTMTGDFGPECVGTASGMNNTSVGICAFVVPTIVASLLGDNYTGIFTVFLVFLVICAVVGGIILPELGEKGKLASSLKAGK